MLIIHPVSEETVRPYLGLPAVVVLGDGSRHFGVLSHVDSKQILLNDAPQTETSGRRAGKTKKAVRTKARAAQRKKTKAARIRQQEDSGPLAEAAQPPAWPAEAAGAVPGPPPYPHPFAQRAALNLSDIAHVVVWL